jgi:hypothetical protein
MRAILAVLLFGQIALLLASFLYIFPDEDLVSWSFLASKQQKIAVINAAVGSKQFYYSLVLQRASAADAVIALKLQEAWPQTNLEYLQHALFPRKVVLFDQLSEYSQDPVVIFEGDLIYTKQ